MLLNRYDSLVPDSLSPKEQILLKEYELCQQSVHEKDRSIWQSFSFLGAGTIAALCLAFPSGDKRLDWRRVRWILRYVRIVDLVDHSESMVAASAF